MVLCLLPSNFRWRQRPRNSSHLLKQVDLSNYLKKYVIRPACILRPQTIPSTKVEATGLRVFVVSDLHTDYSENMDWVRNLSGKRHENDALLVAGDVAETFNNFVLTMSLLKDRFRHVFYVPGNHDLWCCREKHSFLDSLEKLEKLLKECQKLDIQTEPLMIDDLGVVPLLSWYHESFDREKDITGFRIPPLEMVSFPSQASGLLACKALEACKDFRACRWPSELTNQEASLALYFDSMNDKNHDLIEEIKRKCSHIISVSHFLPRQELCPEKRMLFYPRLPKIIGSDFLESRIRSIHGVDGSASACHVFGHTHFCWDALLDGIRYVQAPLAYPRERKRRMNGGEEWLPLCIYSDGHFAEKISPCYWSDYYDLNPRTPDITELAPWVARFYGGLP